MATLLTNGEPRSRRALDDDVDLARDRVLVNRAQAGDRAAFDDLYVRYYRRLYRFCVSRLRDSHEAEDVAQEAFARAWRALATFDGERRFYPWLSVIAAHLCTDVHRRRKRSTPVAEFYQANLASSEDSGEDLMLAAVDSDLVTRAFNRLSDRHQRVLHLREKSEFSYQEIAESEGLPTTAVETLLWRARQALKREFASLARAEGRIAAFVGSGASLAALRRFLRFPVDKARRLAHLGHAGAAFAMGSAAAATALVVAGAMSGPAAQAPAQGYAPGGSAPVSILGGTLHLPGPPAADAGAASGGSGSGSPPVATAAGSSGPQPAGGAHQPGVNGLSGSSASSGWAGGGSSGGAVSSDGSGAGGAGNVPAGGILGGASGGVNGVTQAVGGVENLLNQLAGGVSNSVNAPVSQLPVVSGAAPVVDNALDGATSVVSSVLQSGESLLNGALGSTGVISNSALGSSASGGSAGPGAGLGSGGDLLPSVLGG